MTSRTTALLLLMFTASIAGCGSNALTTGSLFGGNDKPTAPPAPRNDPSSRAFAVGAVTARAQKCGFNFDAPRLKSSLIAFEVQSGTAADELSKSDKLFDRTQSTVAKAIAQSEDYCSDERVAYIRADLNRHLAGDFTPGRPKSFAKEDGGLFNFGGQTPIDDNRPTAVR